MENFFENKENAVDTLTKVFSREIIVEYVHYLIAEKIPFSMALVDIDNFKSLDKFEIYLDFSSVSCKKYLNIPTSLTGLEEHNFK